MMINRYKRVAQMLEELTVGELATLLHVHPSTLTGILSRLEARGVGSRRPDPADKRRALFVLTARGSRLDRLRTGTVESRVLLALAYGGMGIVFFYWMDRVIYRRWERATGRAPAKQQKDERKKG